MRLEPGQAPELKELKAPIEFKPLIDSGYQLKIWDNPCETRYTIVAYHFDPEKASPVYVYYIEYQELIINKEIQHLFKEYTELVKENSAFTQKLMWAYINKINKKAFEEKEEKKIEEELSPLEVIHLIDEVDDEPEVPGEIYKAKEAEVHSIVSVQDGISSTDFPLEQSKAVATQQSGSEKTPLGDECDDTFVKANIPGDELTRVMSLLRMKLPSFDTSDISIAVSSAGDKCFTVDQIMSGESRKGKVLVTWRSMSEHGKFYLECLRKELSRILPNENKNQIGLDTKQIERKGE